MAGGGRIAVYHNSLSLIFSEYTKDTRHLPCCEIWLLCYPVLAKGLALENALRGIYEASFVFSLLFLYSECDGHL
jgi:hypothetical protein